MKWVPRSQNSAPDFLANHFFQCGRPIAESRQRLCGREHVLLASDGGWLPQSSTGTGAAAWTAWIAGDQPTLAFLAVNAVSIGIAEAPRGPLPLGGGGCLSLFAGAGAGTASAIAGLASR